MPSMKVLENNAQSAEAMLQEILSDSDECLNNLETLHAYGSSLKTAFNTYHKEQSKLIMATLKQQCVSDVQSLRQDRSQLKTEVQEVIKMINSKLKDDDLLYDLASVTWNMTVTHEKDAEMNEDSFEGVHLGISPCSPAPSISYSLCQYNCARFRLQCCQFY